MPNRTARLRAGLALAVGLSMTAPVHAQDAPVSSRQAAGPSSPAAGGPADADAPRAESWLPQTGGHLADLARTCRDRQPQTPPAMRNCYAFQAGVIVSALYFARQAQAQVPFCLPEGITDARIAKTIADFVETTPEAGRYPAAGVVVAAMAKDFPCDGAESPSRSSKDR